MRNKKCEDLSSEGKKIMSSGPTGMTVSNHHNTFTVDMDAGYLRDCILSVGLRQSNEVQILSREEMVRILNQHQSDLLQIARLLDVVQEERKRLRLRLPEGNSNSQDPLQAPFACDPRPIKMTPFSTVQLQQPQPQATVPPLALVLEESKTKSSTALQRETQKRAEKEKEKPKKKNKPVEKMDLDEDEEEEEGKGEEEEEEGENDAEHEDEQVEETKGKKQTVSKKTGVQRQDKAERKTKELQAINLLKTAPSAQKAIAEALHETQQTLLVFAQQKNEELRHDLVHRCKNLTLQQKKQQILSEYRKLYAHWIKALIDLSLQHHFGKIAEFKDQLQVAKKTQRNIFTESQLLQVCAQLRDALEIRILLPGIQEEPLLLLTTVKQKKMLAYVCQLFVCYMTFHDLYHALKTSTDITAAVEGCQERIELGEEKFNKSALKALEKNLRVCSSACSAAATNASGKSAGGKKGARKQMSATGGRTRRKIRRLGDSESTGSMYLD